MSKTINDFKCSNCAHLITRTHPDWGNSYTCAKNWFGGCPEPSTYGIRLCGETKDFKKKVNKKQPCQP